MASLTSQPVQSLPTLPTQPFRLDVPPHNLLQRPSHPFPPLASVDHEPRTSPALPSPVFPQHPALMHELDAADIAEHESLQHYDSERAPFRCTNPSEFEGTYSLEGSVSSATSSRLIDADLQTSPRR